MSAATPSAAGSAPPFKVVRATLTSRVAGLVGIVVVVVLALAPQWGDASTMNTLVRLLTLLCLAQMWNLLAGYAGLVSVGQQAFVGVGAYTLVYFGNERGLNVFLCVPLAGLIAAVIALPVAGAAFRLRGGYFAIGTWVIAEVFRLVVSNIDLLGGGTGTSVTAVIGIDPTTRQQVTFWLALAAGAGSVLVAWLLLRSSLGLALRSVRDSDRAASAVGVRVTRVRLAAYVISAAGCAVAGAIIYLNLLRVQPSAAFSVNWTVYMIFMVVIGGLGTIEGPIVGTLLFFGLQEWLGDQGTEYLIILGVVAVLVTIRLPNGLWGWVTERTGASLFPVGRRLELGRDAPAAPEVE
jgi:branched-chain amino acid transport system permease protein